MAHWHIITGEYPPQLGGVSDYTHLVAQALAQAGDEVDVWSPACQGRTSENAGVRVHRLPDHFGPYSLATFDAALNRLPKPCRILVQYVPHAFGWKALNVPFCLWLYSRRRRDSIWVLFHEVAFPLIKNQSLAHHALGMVTRQMASLVARAADRIFVSIPAWECMLRSIVPKLGDITWLPIPSNMPVIDDPASVKTIRTRYASGGDFVLGHFGTYGRHIAELLLALLPSLMTRHHKRVILLLGRGSEDVYKELMLRHPELTGRVHNIGPLAVDDISRHLSACDIMIQPYADGISTRRTSAMAGLSHGLPLITTVGPLTESLWIKSGAVDLAPVGDTSVLVEATQRLQHDGPRRTRMGNAARTLYTENFALDRTIEVLRQTPSNCDAK